MKIYQWHKSSWFIPPKLASSVCWRLPKTRPDKFGSDKTRYYILNIYILLNNNDNNDKPHWQRLRASQTKPWLFIIYALEAKILIYIFVPDTNQVTKANINTWTLGCLLTMNKHPPPSVRQYIYIYIYIYIYTYIRIVYLFVCTTTAYTYLIIWYGGDDDVVIIVIMRRRGMGEEDGIFVSLERSYFLHRILKIYQLLFSFDCGSTTLKTTGLIRANDKTMTVDELLHDLNYDCLKTFMKKNRLSILRRYKTT